MLLLYILWDDWPIFMISSSNEQLQQQLEYILLKPDCHSWWISKMQSGREDTLEERYAIKLCFKLGKNVTETYGMFQTAFGPSCMNWVSCFQWFLITDNRFPQNFQCISSKIISNTFFYFSIESPIISIMFVVMRRTQNRIRFWSSRECRVTASLPLLPDPFWIEVVVPVRALSIIQISIWIIDGTQFENHYYHYFEILETLYKQILIIIII